MKIGNDIYDIKGVRKAMKNNVKATEGESYIKLIALVICKEDVGMPYAW